jgi:hypothetical protein
MPRLPYVLRHRPGYIFESGSGTGSLPILSNRRWVARSAGGCSAWQCGLGLLQGGAILLVSLGAVGDVCASSSQPPSESRVYKWLPYREVSSSVDTLCEYYRKSVE